MKDDEVSSRNSKFSCDYNDIEMLEHIQVLNKQLAKWAWSSEKGCMLEKYLEVQSLPKNGNKCPGNEQEKIWNEKSLVLSLEEIMHIKV